MVKMLFVLPLLIFASVTFAQCVGCPEEELDVGCESSEPCGDCFIQSLVAEDASNDAGGGIDRSVFERY